MELREKIKAEIEEAMGTGDFLLRSADNVEDRFGMQQRLAGEDTIRMFCNGIGNVNPLYRSVDYARNSIHGSLIAPPHFLHAIAWQGGTQKKPLDCISGGFYGGNQAEWFKTIREGDRFTVFTIPGEVKDITREGTAFQFLHTTKTAYKNQKNEIAGIFDSTSVMFVDNNKDGQAPEKRVRKAPEVRYWSEEEVEELYQLIGKEPIRGAEPRYWEDVNVGDQLPPTHHFFTPQQTIAFLSGCGKFEDWRFRMSETKGIASSGFEMRPNPKTGIPEFSDPWWHVFDSVAEREGMDRVFCPGRQLECWLGSLITNWMGDAGFLKKMACQFRALLFDGSRVICRGKIVNKYMEGEEHLVDLHVTLEDHDGVFAVPNCSATVVLPSKNMSHWQFLK
ncbi:MAG: MaoC family dehydratase N-terminal domain-containing protein [Deltaproteobacteria bacterium]|nr:MaoC family dehydratase N-terminal domain-containing protein [Deltaproteobacteria bacterium]